jgi:hypothetical protein
LRLRNRSRTAGLWRGFGTASNIAGGGGMGERAWVKEIGKQLREDMGDCPTLPKEMLDVLRKLDRLEGQKTAGREKAVEHESGGGGPRSDAVCDADDH